MTATLLSTPLLLPSPVRVAIDDAINRRHEVNVPYDRWMGLCVTPTGCFAARGTVTVRLPGSQGRVLCHDVSPRVAEQSMLEYIDEYRRNSAAADTERDRVVCAKAAAQDGDVRAILSYPKGRAFASGTPCSVLPRGAVRRAREIMRARSERRQSRIVAQEAREASTGRILHMVAEKRTRAAAKVAAKAAARRQKKTDQAVRRMRAGKAGRAAVAEAVQSGTWHGQVSEIADGYIRSIVRCVGPIGEQCESDLASLMTDESFSGKRGRHHRLDRTFVTRVQHLRDWSASLITIGDYKSFGSSSWGDMDRNYGSRGGCSYRVYLVVRDTTTKESHILRVPPKFGNDRTQFFDRFRSDKERIQAAVAWTFAQDSSSYRPEVQS